MKFCEPVLRHAHPTLGQGSSYAVTKNINAGGATNSRGKRLRILFVENSSEDIDLVTYELRLGGFAPEVLQILTAEEMRAALQGRTWDMILCDHSLPRFDSTIALQIFKDSGVEIPFIIISGTINEDLVAQAMRNGADDYLSKRNLTRLVPIVERELRQLELRREHRAAEEAIRRTHAQTIRYQDALLKLSVQAKPEWHRALREILQTSAQTLEVERVSYWSLKNRETLVCNALYLRSSGRWESGTRLEKPQCVSYFEGIETHPLIVANDVRSNPSTSQLFGDYCQSHRIVSMLDIPVWLEGKLVGVLCHEQTDTARAWSEPDQKFAVSISHMIALALEEKKRKQAEEALKRSQNDYESLVNSVEGIVWEVDAATLQFTFLSREAERLLGYPLERWLNEPTFWKDHVHPEDRDWVVNYCLAETALGNDHTFEYRMIASDGRIVWLRDIVKVMMENGMPKQLRGIMVEITELKKIERRRTVFSSLAQKLNLTTTPKAAARIIVEAAEELLGWDACSFDLYLDQFSRLQPILTVDTIDGARQDVAPVYKDHSPNPFKTAVLKAGGKLILRNEPLENEEAFIPFGNTNRRSASLIFVPIRNGSKAMGILSIQSYQSNAYCQEDVELLQELADHCGGALERIAAQEAQSKLMKALEVQHRRLDDLLANVPGVVWEAWGQPSAMRTNFMSRYVETLLGYTIEEGRTTPDFWLSIIHPEDKDRVAKEVADLFAHGGHSTERFRWLAKDGRVIWVEAQCNAICDEHGKPIGIRGVTIDISERLRLEAQFRQSQKMESVGQLAGGIAHDFNNILTVIQGHSSLLRASSSMADLERESMEQIATAAERAANLTRQLLTFSRRQVMQTRTLDLNEVVGNFSKMLRRLVGEDISLQVEYSAVPPIVFADAGMMEQLLMNLAVNSRDAMPKGGSLSISTSKLIIDSAHLQQNPEAVPGEAVCLSVSDTGCGIPAIHLPHIYEPFFTTKGVGQGTGLGLATVYGIIKQHRGWIKVQTEEGKGTTFQIFFPSSKDKKTTTKLPTTDTIVRGGTETILVVEDEFAVRKLVQSILKNSGYTILEAENGVAALKLYKQNRDRIDLVLTDMVMPDGMTGLELAEIVQLDRPEMKVIFTSGYNAEIVGKDFNLSDGFNFLQKPYHPKKLTKAVRDCLDGISVTV